MSETLIDYFHGDDLAASTFLNKYALTREDGTTEATPDEMHLRLAKEFARIELNYAKRGLKGIPNIDLLSEHGKTVEFNLQQVLGELQYPIDSITRMIYGYFKNFQYIIPGGSVMSGLGNTSSIGSFSNCFVIGQPEDSYSGIMKLREEQAHLMKRRGGVGKDLSTLRPNGSNVMNAAKSSTGAASFMDVDSAITNEVAQNGRRGALMLTLDVRHPDILQFITKKQDLTKVTGANISVKLTDDFMLAVEKDEDYILRFPVDSNVTYSSYPDNELVYLGYNHYCKKVKAREIWNALVHCAWNTAEPGIMFSDTHIKFSPDGVYDEFRGVSTNPCFHPDTLIETVEGKKRIADITEPTYVYSMNTEGHICIMPCSAAFKTKENADTIKITLRNGSSIQITPEHKMYVHGYGFVEARFLTVGDRINHVLRTRRGKKYVGIKLTSEGNREYVMEHRLVYEGIFGNTTNDIHHIDGNTFNNNINNLQAISHSEHARITALEQNPQSHQIRENNSGKYAFNPNKVVTGIKNLPVEIATKFKSKFDNCIISIEEGDKIDVYDIQVEGTNCLIANNMLAHNCGEIFMQPYDSCRLIHLNLTSIVSKAFAEDSSYDTNLLYEIAYMATRLADNLVDLEIEAVDKIINHINSSKGEKRNELELWLKLKNSAIRGRRCGIGFTGLADMLAMLGFPYGGVDSICVVDRIMQVIMKAELDCTIDLAITRGAFLAWDNSIEYPKDEGGNNFYRFLKDHYPERVEIMKHVGRRNISWNTVAPTGTVSLMTGTTSGIEPVFSAYYMRRRKCMNFNDRVDFTDENGEKFTEFPVIHPMFKKWIDYNSDINNIVKIDSIEKLSKEDLESLFKLSPWYGSIASDIDYKDRIAIQSAVQRYTTHSISSTINLPASATEADVSTIYNAAYNRKLKGITVYRDKCRDGILNTIDTPVENSNNIDFEYYSAPKRPRILPAQLHVLTSGGNKFAVIVGLMNLKPFEVFAYPLTEDDFNVLSNDPNSIKKGHITKVRKGYYKYEDGNYTCDGIQGSSSLNAEMTACTMYISMLLRHRADIKFIIKTAKKVDNNIASFTSAICRVLGKYIPKEIDKNDLCPECGQPLLHEGGCIKCLNCSYSKCMMMIVMK